MKFDTLIALSKIYISIKFRMILIKCEEDMHNSRSNVLPIYCHAYRKTVSAIVLKFLSGIHILVKVD